MQGGIPGGEGRPGGRGRGGRERGRSGGGRRGGRIVMKDGWRPPDDSVAQVLKGGGGREGEREGGRGEWMEERWRSLRRERKIRCTDGKASWCAWKGGREGGRGTNHAHVDLGDVHEGAAVALLCGTDPVLVEEVRHYRPDSWGDKGGMEGGEGGRER